MQTHIELEEVHDAAIFVSGGDLTNQGLQFFGSLRIPLLRIALHCIALRATPPPLTATFKKKNCAHSQVLGNILAEDDEQKRTVSLMVGDELLLAFDRFKTNVDFFLKVGPNANSELTWQFRTGSQPSTEYGSAL